MKLLSPFHILFFGKKSLCTACLLRSGVLCLSPWGQRKHLHKLFGILLHGRFFYLSFFSSVLSPPSPPSPHFFSVIYLYKYRLITIYFYTLKYNLVLLYFIAQIVPHLAFGNLSVGSCVPLKWFIFVVYICLFNFSLSFFSFQGTAAAYESSWARDWIGAVAANPHHSHSNARSELHLWPTPQLTEALDP